MTCRDVDYRGSSAREITDKCGGWRTGESGAMGRKVSQAVDIGHRPALARK